MSNCQDELCVGMFGFLGCASDRFPPTLCAAFCVSGGGSSSNTVQRASKGSKLTLMMTHVRYILAAVLLQGSSFGRPNGNCDTGCQPGENIGNSGKFVILGEDIEAGEGYSFGETPSLQKGSPSP